MSDFCEALLQAVLAEPGHVAPRFILSDYLVEEGAEDDLIDFVRYPSPWLDELVRAVYGPRAWVRWVPTRRLRFRPDFIVNSGTDNPRMALRVVLDHLRGRYVIRLREVQSAIDRLSAQEVARRVRRWEGNASNNIRL